MKKIYKNKTELINDIITLNDTVLDVGFWGQGVSHLAPNWVHNILKKRAYTVYGIDLDFDESKVSPKENYLKASAESFHFREQRFNVIFASDLIEHLSNPGLFLSCARKHLNPGGRIIVTTPNCFNLFNLTEKITKGEPTVNYDHTCYFNDKTLRQLFKKNGFKNFQFTYIYSLDLTYKQSFKKKILNVVYKIISLVTPRYIESVVIVASV